ncbi:DUF4381 domain-containing protein [Bowmanella dokdonensis]|uniref:DUF4381 domain-containing protein n=1 Tax=Bowmanella dokdonensis TaxID=751969 RepID=A0A939ISH8_9ALTE|nr:DUF4381 domain-containing protein [Bowmanella dokdonensis]MBN7826742.1 DUF4381 domain-containing protein [Bowmanella dokdonensis]
MSPLEQLRDIHLPEAVDAWPPAYGWWLLALLILGLLFFSFIALKRRRRQRLATRQALEELEQIDYQRPDWPAQVNGLLKRLTISYLPRESSASLHDQAWLAFLARLLPKKRREDFIQGYRPLLASLYRPESAALDARASRELVRNWIRQALPVKTSRLEEDLHV